MERLDESLKPFYATVLHNRSHDHGSIPDPCVAARARHGPKKLGSNSLHHQIIVKFWLGEDWLACLD